MAVIYGTSVNDTLYGTASADTIYCYDGADIAYGGAGNDFLSGSFGADQLFGEDGNDELTGGGQNDLLVGGYGADTMWGDTGDDYIVSHWDGYTDTIYGGDGVDLWEADFTNYYAAVNFAIPASTTTVVAAGMANFQNIERLDVIGTGFNDLIYGGNYTDYLTGGAGDDGLTGGSGTDYLDGGIGNDALLGGVGDDYLWGWTGTDYLIGNDGADTLYGEDGGDEMQGILGADQMWGGAGNDLYLYYSAADSTVASGGRDRIHDFAAGDRIDLSRVDANSAIAGDQAFAFAAGAAANSVWTVTAGGVTSVFGDLDGNAMADFQIDLTNGFLLAATDFIL